MSSTLLVRNLPADATEDDIRRALEHHAKILAIELRPDVRKDTDRKSAVISLDTTSYEAELIAEKFNGRIVGGQPISLYAAMHE